MAPDHWSGVGRNPHGMVGSKQQKNQDPSGAYFDNDGR